VVLYSLELEKVAAAGWEFCTGRVPLAKTWAPVSGSQNPEGKKRSVCHRPVSEGMNGKRRAASFPGEGGSWDFCTLLEGREKAGG